MVEQPEAQQAEANMKSPLKEEEKSPHDADAAAAAASTADAKADPGTVHPADMSEDGSDKGEGQQADYSSMEYAGDLNVSDDEATLEEEEVSSYTVGLIQKRVPLRMWCATHI